MDFPFFLFKLLSAKKKIDEEFNLFNSRYFCIYCVLISHNFNKDKTVASQKNRTIHVFQTNHPDFFFLFL